ncbi:hypothetical protein ACBR42_09430 [Komagataeibacter sp. SM21]
MLAFRATFPQAGATGRMDGNRAIAEVSGEDFFKKIPKKHSLLEKRRHPETLTCQPYVFRQ